MQETNFKKGILFAFSAYFMWGILPLYWALIKGIDATETLMFRIILSLVFMMILLPLMKKWSVFKSDLQQLVSSPKNYG